MSWNEFWPMIAQVLLTAIVLAIVLLLAGVAIGGVITMLRTAFGRGPQRKIKGDTGPMGPAGKDAGIAAGGFVADTSGNQHHG